MNKTMSLQLIDHWIKTLKLQLEC